MKQNIKIFLIALLIGIVVTYVYCTKFDNTILTSAKSITATYFYIGSYNNISEATTKQNSYPTSIIYEDNGIYRVIIGIYTKQESIDLMASYFNDQNINFQISTLKVTNDYLINAENYELLILSGDKEYYEQLNSSLLKVFNEYIN